MSEPIKSALERALERAEKLGKASPEELAEWTYQPEGEKIAARFLKMEQVDIKAELNKLPAAAQPTVAKVIENIFLANIDVPRTPQIKGAALRAIEGVRALKSDKKRLDPILTGLQGTIQHYETVGRQQLQQAYQQLHKQFESQAQAMQGRQGQRRGPEGQAPDVEALPEFAAAWHQVQTDFDTQYDKVIKDQKESIRRLH